MKDDSDWTPLIIASSAGHLDIVRMLVERGASVNEVTAEGRSALLYAASKGRDSIVQFLLEKGADVNKADKLGATPLHRWAGSSWHCYGKVVFNTFVYRASGPGHSDVVKMLLGSDNLIVDCPDRSVVEFFGGRFFGVLECNSMGMQVLILVVYGSKSVSEV